MNTTEVITIIVVGFTGMILYCLWIQKSISKMLGKFNPRLANDIFEIIFPDK